MFPGSVEPLSLYLGRLKLYPRFALHQGGGNLHDHSFYRVSRAPALTGEIS